jgi:hypothetical protein
VWEQRLRLRFDAFAIAELDERVDPRDRRRNGPAVEIARCDERRGLDMALERVGVAGPPP